MLYEILNEQGNLTTWSIPNPARQSAPAPVKPLHQADNAPLFRLGRTSGVWSASLASLFGEKTDVSLSDLLRERPLVLSFYCPCWNSYAPKHLAALRDLYPKIKGLGGDLLVLTNESPKSLSRLAEYHHLPFSLAHDTDYQVARAFGVYSDESPVWQRVAGISDDVFTPAIYVIGRNRRIAFDFVDEDFDQQLDARALLSAVYKQKS